MKLIVVWPILFVILFNVRATAQTKARGVAPRAIICLTYDDGLESQLATAIPQLDSAGIRATFFLNSIQGSSQSDKIGQTPEAVIGWTNAAKRGHELANHTLFHPCPENLGWIKDVAIDGYTVERILAEIKTQNTILQLIDPKVKRRSFAFPCNNVLIGNIDYSKVLAAQGLVTFGRIGGDSTSIIKSFREVNPMQVPSWHVWTGTTSSQLISFAEKVKAAGGLGIYQFHGIGGQVFQISASTHRAVIQYLAAHKDDYQVVPFTEAMEILKSR